MGAFEEKVVIVVGGGRGIGRATALALAREGARLVIQDPGVATDGTGQDPGVARAVADEIRAAGGTAIALDLNATREGAAQASVEAALSSYGRLDAGFYAAGVMRERPLVRESDAELDLLLDVHVRGAFRFARELTKALIEQKRGGSLLLCSGAAGFSGTPGQSALAASAMAVVGMVRAAASELRRQGVRINCLVPTARTRLTEELPLFRSIRADSLSAEHAAAVASFLLSDAAAELSGEVVGVAGGRVYAFRTHETPGLFEDGAPLALSELGARFRQVLEG